MVPCTTTSTTPNRNVATNPLLLTKKPQKNPLLSTKFNLNMVPCTINDHI